MNTLTALVVSIAAFAGCAAPRETQPTTSPEVKGIELLLTADNCVCTEPNVRVSVYDDFLPAGSSFYVDNFKLYQDDRVRAEVWEDESGGLIAALGPPGGLAWIQLTIHMRREGDRILVTPHMAFPNCEDEGEPPVIDQLRGSIRLAGGTWKAGGPVLFDVNLIGGGDTVFLARGEARGGVPDLDTWSRSTRTGQ